MLSNYEVSIDLSLFRLILVHLYVVQFSGCVIRNACCKSQEKSSVVKFVTVQMHSIPPGLSVADRPERKKKGDG